VAGEEREAETALERAASEMGVSSRSNSLGEAGVSGLIRYGGFIDEEFLPQLKGRRGRAVYREMADNDPVCAGVLLAVDLLIRQVNYQVRPADDQVTTGAASSSNAAQLVADRVRGAFHDMEDTWEDTESTIANSMLTFGFSWHEEVLRYCKGYVPDEPGLSSNYEDGWLTWSNLPIRAAESLYAWEFDDGVEDGPGRVTAFLQQAAPSWETKRVPWRQSMHFRTTAAKGNPEGRSIFRSAYRPWYYKRKIEEIEGVGVERDLAGLPVVWMPKEYLYPSANANQKALATNMRDMVRKVRRNEAEGLVMPYEVDDNGHKMFDFTLLAAAGSRQFDTNGLVQRKNVEIALCAMADVLLMGHEQVGTQALGMSKVDLFTAGIGAWLGQMDGEFNQVGIPRLCRLNGIPRELWPTIEHGQIKSVDLNEVGNFIRNLGQGGAPLWPNDVLLGFLLEQADLPTGDLGGGEL
jgi:hypothetical protein